MWFVALSAAFAAGYFTHRNGSRHFALLISYLLGRNSCGLAPSYRLVREIQWHEVLKLKAQSHLLKESDGLELWQTPSGEFWNPRGNDIFFALAEQSLRNYGDGPNRVQAGDIVLDCGANIGDFVREALSAGAKCVIAIEPVPRSVVCLQRTFSAEIAAGSVRIVQKAVWHEAGNMKMAVHENALLDTLVPGSNSGVPVQHVDVPLVTIDTLVSELNLPRVDFIKMDIEGAEPNALRGARHTIAAFRPRMAIATEHSPGEYGEVRKAVQEAAAYRSACGPCWRSGLNFYPEVTWFTPIR